MGAFKGKYSSTEDADCLDVNRLVAVIKRTILKKFKGLNADEVRARVGFNLEAFRIEDQSFKFTSLANKQGGVRWMVFCPKCGSRVVKLYLPKSVSEGVESKYFCKNCHNLRPPSALYGPTRRYKELIRPQRRMEKIKTKLRSTNLSNARTEELLNEYDKLDEQVRNSTFYRKMCLLSPGNNDT